MTEFEEITFKKIIKAKLVNQVYGNINLLAAKYGISNSEISKKIGWDPAGFNQKYNRSNDLRISTFINIYVAISDIIAEKEEEFGLQEEELANIDMAALLGKDEFRLGQLFCHISAVAEGKSDFLSDGRLIKTYRTLKPFVISGKRSKKFTDKEIDVYIRKYNELNHP